MPARLSDTYEVFDTESPEQAIALALEHRPDAVPLDLMMAKFGVRTVPELPGSHLK
jgi:DNA-binding NarL/FixJ family response regulator